MLENFGEILKYFQENLAKAVVKIPAYFRKNLEKFSYKIEKWKHLAYYLLSFKYLVPSYLVRHDEGKNWKTFRQILGKFWNNLI